MKALAVHSISLLASSSFIKIDGVGAIIFVGGSFCFRKESEGGLVATCGTVATQVQIIAEGLQINRGKLQQHCLLLYFLQSIIMHIDVVNV